MIGVIQSVSSATLASDQPVPPSQKLRFASSVLNFLAFRFAWAGLGAVVGLYVFLGTGLMLPGIMRWLGERDIELGSGTTLPFTALAWLAFAAAGAVVFTRGWSAVLASVTRRMRAE